MMISVEIPKNVIIAVLVLSVLANIFLFVKLDEAQQALAGPSYRYVRPLEPIKPDADVQEESVILHYNGLRLQLEEEINRTTDLSNVGVFVQDAQTGAWMGINEKRGFVPASLLKVPFAMVIIKKVERGEIGLGDQIELIPDDIDPGSGTLYQKGAGYKITVRELLNKMVLSSDNTAKNALLRLMSYEEANSVFAHVGIRSPNITAREMTRIFKALYYSTYLKPEYSEMVLDISTDTDIENLLSAGIPPEIQVAHKYGERPGVIHDCGIVYHAENPYFICVMTTNMEKPVSKDLISKISKIAFEFVEKVS